jgi:hypothetical protein
MAKVTKRDKFVAISEALVEAGADVDLIEFVAGEVALIDKRKAAPRKPTADQLANEALKSDIVAFLEGTGTGVTATDLSKVFDVSVQKVSALLRQLVIAGTVTKTEATGKEKALFSA